MSGILGRRLYANVWEAASPVFARGLRTNHGHKGSPFDTANPSTIFRGFFVKNLFGRIYPLPPRNTRQITRRFASGGFFVLGASPNPAAAVETGTACALSPDKMICHSGPCYLDRKLLNSLRRNAWRRNLHTSKDDRANTEAIEPRTGIQNENRPPEVHKGPRHETRSQASKPPGPNQEQNVPTSPNKHLKDRLPQMPQLHRPTKEELLAAANGFWSRLKVRFKWFSIRSVRPFNLDEITALFSWVLLGHVLWIILGTTTFFSLLIFAINTVFAQGKINRLKPVGIFTECCRNLGRVGRELSNQVIGRQSRIRVRDCSKVEGWRDYL